MTDETRKRKLWRVGKSVPINVYEGDRPVCQCHTALDAKRIVEAMTETVKLSTSEAMTECYCGELLPGKKCLACEVRELREVLGRMIFLARAGVLYFNSRSHKATEEINKAEAVLDRVKEA